MSPHLIMQGVRLTDNLYLNDFKVLLKTIPWKKWENSKGMLIPLQALMRQPVTSD